MKRILTLLMTVGLLAGLCACTAPGTSTDWQASLPSLPSEKSESSSEPESSESADGTLPESDSSEIETTEGEPEDVSLYIKIVEVETAVGVATVPEFNFAQIGGVSGLANDWFRALADITAENAEAMGCAFQFDPSYALHGSQLSVLVEYTDSEGMPSYEALTIDVATGEAIDPFTTVTAAGFTDEEVSDALVTYTSISGSYEWQYNAFYEMARKNEKIEGIGFGWIEAFDEVINAYYEAGGARGDGFDELPRDPTVYYGDDGLYVAASIPDYTQTYRANALVHIGDSTAQTCLYNPLDLYGQPFQRGVMSEEAAFANVAQTMRLDDGYTDPDGVTYDMECENLTLVEDKPSFVIRVFNENESVVARWAVGMFTGEIWSMEDNAWVLVMNGTGLLPESLYTIAYDLGAFTVVWNEPDAFETWAADPCGEIDLIPYSTDTSFAESGGDTLLLVAKEDVELSFVQGFMDGETFSPQSDLCSLQLFKGKSVIIHVQRPEGSPSQAVLVSAGDRTGVYVFQYAGLEQPEFEYITD